jgi:hypothetical protein|tara:strand:+ start:13335 stop:13778 length:444 start_codon:yes stop_codon:yes gene_type:complete
MGKYEQDADAVLEKKGVSPDDPLVLPLLGPVATTLYNKLYKKIASDKPDETVAENQRAALDQTFQTLQLIKKKEWRDDYKRDGYVLMFSPIFDEQFYLCRDKQAFNKLNFSQPLKVYMERELLRLKDIKTDDLKCLHWAKEFHGEIL